MRESSWATDAATRRRDVLIVLSAALLARFICLWQLHDSWLMQLLMGDGYTYDQWAQTLIAGDWVGSQTFYQAPLYPYFMGAVYSIFGHSLLALRVVQLLLGATACVFIQQAASCWFGRRVGLIAGIMLALYPPAIFFDLIIQKSVLDGVLLSALLWWFASTKLDMAVGRWAVGGALLGMLMLSRENAVVLVPATVAWAALGFRVNSGKQRIAACAVLLAAMAFILFPVCLRNYMVGGSFHLTTSQFGPNFYIGNNPSADGHYMELVAGRGDARYERGDARRLAEQAVGRELSPAEVSSYWSGKAFGWIRSEPGDWLKLIGKKLLLTFNRIEISDVDDIYTATDESGLLRSLMWVWHLGVVIPLAVVGIFAACEQLARLWPLYLCIVLYATGVVLFFVFARYRYPLAVMLMPLAAYGVAQLYHLVRRLRALMIPVASAIGIACVVNYPIESINAMKAGTYHNIGWTLVDEAGDVPAAIAALDRAVSLADNRPTTHELIARLYAQQNEPEKAESHFEKALLYDPQNAQTLTNFAVLLGQHARHDEAIGLLQRAAKIDPDNPAIQFNLAIALENSGRSGEAEAVLQSLCATDDASDPHFGMLVRILRNAGQPEAANKILEAGLTRFPESRLLLSMRLQHPGNDKK